MGTLNWPLTDGHSQRTTTRPRRARPEMPSTGWACWMLDDGRAPDRLLQARPNIAPECARSIGYPGSRTTDGHGAEGPRPQPAQRDQERGSRSRGGTPPLLLYALARPADGRTPARPGATGGHRAKGSLHEPSRLRADRGVNAVSGPARAEDRAVRRSHCEGHVERCRRYHRGYKLGAPRPGSKKDLAWHSRVGTARAVGVTQRDSFAARQGVSVPFGARTSRHRTRSFL